VHPNGECVRLLLSAHDLGWYQRHRGSTAFDHDTKRISTWLADLTVSIDLVMILEHMDASLVLLANALGLPSAVVGKLTCALNVFPGEHTRLGSEHYLIGLSLHTVDVALYRHFERRLQPQVEHLQHEMRKLRGARHCA